MVLRHPPVPALHEVGVRVRSRRADRDGRPVASDRDVVAQHLGVASHIRHQRRLLLGTAGHGGEPELQRPGGVMAPRPQRQLASLPPRNCR